MKRLEFNCICELAEIMDEYVKNHSSEDEYPVVSAYGDYEIAKALVEELIMFGNPIGNIIELESYEMDCYDKEFVIYLSEDGVACEKTANKNNYYFGCADISFVHEDCNSKLLNYIDSDIVYEFGIVDEYDDEECDCDGCCECCDCNDELCIETDGDMHGFSVNNSDENSWSSFSFYSTDIGLVEEMAKKFR